MKVWLWSQLLYKQPGRKSVLQQYPSHTRRSNYPLVYCTILESVSVTKPSDIFIFLPSNIACDLVFFKYFLFEFSLTWGLNINILVLLTSSTHQQLTSRTLAARCLRMSSCILIWLGETRWQVEERLHQTCRAWWARCSWCRTSWGGWRWHSESRECSHNQVNNDCRSCLAWLECN